MKALSLWQPYASFMRDDLKSWETRGRHTNVRGDVAICAAVRKWKPDEFGADVDRLVRLMLATWQPGRKIEQSKMPRCFSYGVVLCVVELYDCRPVESVFPSPLERMVGNYASGRFAWLTRNCRRLKTPVPVVGHQGFFNLPPDVEQKVREQL